jgi:sphinganine-1-phosphate aldolase
MGVDFGGETLMACQIPTSASCHDDVLGALRRLRRDDADRAGRMWSLVYSAGADHDAVLADAYREYSHENGLSPTAFPSLARMESDIVAMMLAHLGADPERAVGTMASGGTESIILAVKAYRDAAGLESPSLVMPSTAHPAFIKAAELLQVRPVVVPVSDGLVADVDAMHEAVDASTVMIAASAPAYPYGLVDPISDLAELAGDRGVGLHVDACLGGIQLPFLRELGHDVPPFDFAVGGVTSMSVDLHKYGFGPKGSSTVLYRTKELRRHQFTVNLDWPGGIVASPTLLGTRSGGIIAAAWAGLHHLGADGYCRIFSEIMRTTQRLRAGVTAIGDMYVLGDPPMSVFAIASDSRDVFAMADVLEDRGWRMDRQSEPDCLHHIVNLVHAEVVDEYLSDLNYAYDLAPPRPDGAWRATNYGVTSVIDVAGDPLASVLTQLEAWYDSR